MAQEIPLLRRTRSTGSEDGHHESGEGLHLRHHNVEI